VTLNNSHSQRPFYSKRSFRFASYSTLALIALSAPLGCGPTEPKEISAATSGFRPSDKSKSSKSDNPPTIAPKSTQPTTASEGLPTAPELPRIEPGKIDPKIAAKSYMKLALGEKQVEAPGLVTFMADCSRAIKELIADGRQKRIGTDLILERGMELSRMKLEAAQRLSKVASTDDEKVTAALGRIEGLSQLAGFGDVLSADELRTVISEEVNNPDVRVSQQARSISLSLLVADFQSGSATAEQLVAEAALVLTSGAKLSTANLNSLGQTVMALEQKGDEANGLELARKIEEAFRDSEDPQLGMGSWQLYASHLDEARQLSSFLENPNNDSMSPDEIKTKTQSLMEKIPSQWTAIFLAKIANNMEYSGKIDLAKFLVGVATPQVEKSKQKEVRDELLETFQQFEKRIGILNNTLDLSALVDVDGKPIDMSRYQGKVVLVDFWATWCAPCLREIPNIEAAYNKHHAAGFEVVGINLDDTKEKLVDFLGAQSLPWSTYVSNDPQAVGFDTPLAKSIGVSSIPFIAIIGKDGKVAAIHVRGQKIEGTVAELLAKE
jgi:thiol-disulfide isomerase/thioredoxin